MSMDELVRQLAATLAIDRYHPGEGESCKTCSHYYKGKCHSKKAQLHKTIQYCKNYYRRN